MQSPATLKKLFDNSFSPTQWIETYYHQNCHFLDDCVKKQIEALSDIFSSGMIKGDTLLSFTLGPTMHELLAVCEPFKEIIMSNVTAEGVCKLKEWVEDKPGATDWSLAAKMLCEHEGNRGKWMEKQEKLRGVIKQILLSDLTKSNPFEPLTLPPVDCLLSVYCLESLNLEKPSYKRALKTMSSLVKRGGYIVLVSLPDCAYFMVGSCKFPHLRMEAEFVSEALCEAGLVLEKQVMIPRVDQELYEVINCSGTLISVARKE
ncbi:nicotinamide N-methyltransferase-like [Ambystoma mexicanum]|uniref:nicotinamide N-methyltransferase-like n=1 Tax=Ambystoma mexicanum TaxID=8296 RepID=UPI0037E80BFA